jgi:8-oxo-dGTP diphosphatase
MGTDRRPVNLRCSALVLREDSVLLCRRADDWVLPGGTPAAHESAAACVRREVREETGLAVTPVGVAFVLDATNSAAGQHLMEIVFLAHSDDKHTVPYEAEDGLVPEFVPLERLAALTLRPPIGGHIRALHRGDDRVAEYLGNVWRPPVTA